MAVFTSEAAGEEEADLVPVLQTVLEPEGGTGRPWISALPLTSVTCVNLASHSISLSLSFPICKVRTVTVTSVPRCKDLT